MNHENIANYAHDNTPDVSEENTDKVVRFLEESSCVIFKWYSDNKLQANASKRLALLSTNQQVQINIGYSA